MSPVRTFIPLEKAALLFNDDGQGRLTKCFHLYLQRSFLLEWHDRRHAIQTIDGTVS